MPAVSRATGPNVPCPHLCGSFNDTRVYTRSILHTSAHDSLRDVIAFWEVGHCQLRTLYLAKLDGFPARCIHQLCCSEIEAPLNVIRGQRRN